MPIDPIERYRRLFVDDSYELFEEDGDWDMQSKELDERRGKAIREVVKSYGMEGIKDLVRIVESPGTVGNLMVDYISADVYMAELLNLMSSVELDEKTRPFVECSVFRRQIRQGWSWVDDLDRSQWSISQTAQFLSFLPFEDGTWSRAQMWLQGDEKEYWKITRINPYHSSLSLKKAIDKLIQFNRSKAALECIYSMHMNKQSIDSELSVRALLAAVESDEPDYTVSTYHIIEVIKSLQNNVDVEEDAMLQVEWAYLPILDRHNRASPKYLESKLSTDPRFFCEIIRMIYRSETKVPEKKESTEREKMIATNAWRLLNGWRIPPGLEVDGGFSVEKFEFWIKSVRNISSDTGHQKSALSKAGAVLVYTPADQNGLWINHAVALELNRSDSDALRSGYRTKLFNMRGAHFVDPEGKPEKKIASEYREKANAVEGEGYHRIARMLNDLAESYDKQAESIIEEHKNDIWD